MVTTWVLIVYFHAGYAGGATSAEFNSKQDCLQAIEVLKSEAGWDLEDAVCVPKGTV